MIGKHVQNYEIKAHLGEGGMGTVYRAGDSVLGREVALKMLHAPLLQQPLFLERFKKEARLLAQLLHPNIAVIYNMIEQDNNHFMVMEYVEGKNLESLLKQYRTLSFKVVVPAMIQALEGLHHAHKKGIYHRDIKPSNLILTPDGTVKLMDFGIAMMAGEQRLTQVNRVVGTIEYLAPELIQGKEPSVATDLYAMGVTMYELLTGRLPFEGNTDFNLMQDILKKKPLAVEKMNGSVPKALSSLVMRALEKNGADRFADAKTFQQALANAFPDLRQADLDANYIKASVTVPVTTSTPVKKTPKPTVLVDTDAQRSTRPVPLFDSLKQKTLAKENRVVVFSIAAVLLTAVFAIVFTAGSSKNKLVEDLSQAEKTTQADSAKNKVARTETAFENRQPVNNGGTYVPDPVIKRPADNNVEQKEPVRDEKKEPAKEEKKDPKKKDEPKKKEETKEPDQKKQEVIPVTQPEVVEKKEETKPVEKKEARSVRLSSNVSVNLYLREALSTSSQPGQSLIFVVSSPVRYDGEVIVEKGAIAKGMVRSVGKKKISIVITSVTSAGGQSLPLLQEELSGRIEDMISSRNYSATIKKGSTINF